MGREESQEWDLSGRVEGVGLISWVNARPLACLAPSARTRALFWRVYLNGKIALVARPVTRLAAEG